MLRIVQKNISLANKQNHIYALSRKFANQATSITQTDEDYAKALPFDKLPGPGISGLVMGSFPGGNNS